MRQLTALSLLVFALGFVGCRKEAPLCGFPIVHHLVSYEIVDATTGRDLFAAGKLSADSLRLLASDQGPGQVAVRVGTGARLGPIRVLNNQQRTITHLLRFGARDVDTVVTVLRFGPLQRGACEDFAPFTEVEIIYNLRSNTILRANVPSDSLALYERGGRGKVVKLRKWL